MRVPNGFFFVGPTKISSCLPNFSKIYQNIPKKTILILNYTVTKQYFNKEKKPGYTKIYPKYTRITYQNIPRYTKKIPNNIWYILGPNLHYFSIREEFLLFTLQCF
jgi:hypothetical protein